MYNFIFQEVREDEDGDHKGNEDFRLTSAAGDVGIDIGQTFRAAGDVGMDIGQTFRNV